MRYDRAMPIAERLVEELSCACLRIEIKGSLSRHETDVGDIEIVAIPKYEPTGQTELFSGPAQMRNLLHSRISGLGEDRLLPIKPGKTRLADGSWELDDKWRAKALTDARYFRLWLPREEVLLDLFMATRQTWGAIATIRTGKAGFSQRLVTAWTKKSKGGHVHRGRVYRPWKIGQVVDLRTPAGVPLGDPLDTPEERDFFRVLGIDWVEPRDRR